MKTANVTLVFTSDKNKLNLTLEFNHDEILELPIHHAETITELLKDIFKLAMCHDGTLTKVGRKTQSGRF